MLQYNYSQEKLKSQGTIGTYNVIMLIYGPKDRNDLHFESVRNNMQYPYFKGRAFYL